MSANPTRWYTKEEAAQEFEKPTEQIERIYKQAVEQKLTSVAYYQGPDTPMLIGAYLIKLFTGKEYAV